MELISNDTFVSDTTKKSFKVLGRECFLKWHCLAYGCDMKGLAEVN